MRHKDREIQDHDEMDRILSEGIVCRLGLSDDGLPYIVPLNYGYAWKKHGLELYFHCASTGRKLEIIAGNNRACCEIDRAGPLHTADSACKYAMAFESLIGFGEVGILTDPDSRLAAMNQIMQHYSGCQDWSFQESVMKQTTLLCMRVHTITGKKHA